MTFLTGFSVPSTHYSSGTAVPIRATFSDPVSVSAGSSPFLSLSNGATASYVGQLSDTTLLFNYDISANDNATPSLSVTGFASNNAIIRDSLNQLVTTTVTPGVNSQVLTTTAQTVVIDISSPVSHDLIAPKVTSVESVSGNYKVGDKVTVSVVFDEAVGVTPGAQLPTLSFTSNGEVLTDVIGSYVSGSGTKKLNFTFTVTEAMDVADLEVSSLNVNGSVLADASGNVVSNINGAIALPVLPSTVAVSLGDQSEAVVTTVEQSHVRIESIRYLSDDTEAFKVGDVLDFSVRMTGITHVDTTNGVPTLVLGNGGLATYVSGSDSNTLTFRYVVSSVDRNTTDLKVLGVAENDALFLGSAGQLADVRISATNNLSLFNDVKINAQSPYITRIDSTTDTLGLGDSVEFMVNFSETVELTGEAPTLTLSNGATATYVSGSPSNVLLFRYTAVEGDADSSDLDVTGFDAPNSTLMSLAGHGEASLSLAKAASVASQYEIEVDSTRPEGVITFESTQLIAGESTGVTITFTESVTNPHAAITVSNGTLSALVAVEGTASERTVWKGTFTPTSGIDSSDTTLVLDNSLVKDDAGNTGSGISVSAPLSIDTLGPVVSMSNEVLFNGNRLITIDLGETVTDFSVDDIVVSNGIKVTSGFSEVEANRVYTLEVSPSSNGAVGDLKVTLRKGSVSDALGNVNAEQSFTTGWDVKAPEIESISATNGIFTVGDTLSIAVRYDEVVNVDTTKGVPFLALNNGAKAEYVSGSESDTLVFEYVIQAGDYADRLDVMAMVKDSGVIEDNSGNAARTMIGAGINLGDMSSVEIDGVAPSIVTMTAESGLYLAGDTATITVQFSEAVYVDTTGGSPILALSNGSVATYVDGSGSNELTFTYEVQANDFDTTDLDVHALIENGSTLQDAAGNDANLVLQSVLNHLSYRSDVVVDAATPYINTISANAGYYKAGDTIDIALGWNKPVVMDDALGTPEIKLSNGEVVALNRQLTTANTLVFSYTIKATDFETDGLDALKITEFRSGFATFSSFISGVDADLTVTLPNDGAIALAEGGIYIDVTGPELDRLTVLDSSESNAFKAGESATVTLSFKEAVKEVLPEYFTLEHGELGNFSTEDNITWTATFIPTKDTDAGEQSLSLDLSNIADLAGNYGAGQSIAASYTLDSEYPTAVLSSDVDGVINEAVRFIVNFSETVKDFDLTKVSVLNGTIDVDSLETPDNAGRPEGEYSFIVIPDANSTQPIKVQVLDGVVTDLADNPNKLSQVLVQPVDTVQAKIASIHAQAGAYAVGDTVRFEVNFSEAVELLHNPTAPHSDAFPTLFLNNGELATYVSGSGSDTWVFEYTYAADDATSSRPLQVLSFLENDKLVLDTAGNRTHTVLNSSNRLKETVIVDGEGPVVAGFSAIEANYNSSEASEGGVYNIGDVVWIKLNTSEWVSVDSAAGRPTLELANGGSASYVSGSGSDTLLFRYVVKEGDASTEALSVSSITMNGGSIVDVAGNALDISTLTSDSVLGIAKSTKTVVVDADAPIVELVTLVEDAGTNTDVTNDGYYKAGSTLAFDVSFDDALIVDTTDGAPVLTLSNGQLAEYVLDKSDLANGVMRFEYTVLADDINTIDLKVLGLAEQGAVITDDAGNDAIVDIDPTQLSYEALVVDTVRPVGEMQIAIAAQVTDIATAVDVRLVFDEQIDLTTLSAADFSFSVSADSVLGDGQGGLLTELPIDFAAQIVEGSFVKSADGEVSFKLMTPDLLNGDLIVSLNDAALTDLAGNALEGELSAHYSVDTLTTSLDIIPVAGPFTGSLAQVTLYRADGVALTQDIDYVIDPAAEAADGRVQITLLNGYRGPLLVEVNDQDAQSGDYQDELTLQSKSLNTSLRTMVEITEPAPEAQPIAIVVSPLTELATRKAGYAEGVIPTDLSSEKVVYNDKVAKLFNLEGVDIARTPVTTTLDSAFNAEDGLSESEAYGEALATLSAQDAVSGSVRSTIEVLVAGTTEDTIDETGNTQLTFTADTEKALEQSANVIDLMQDVGVDTTLTADEAIARADALRAVIRTAAGEEPFATVEQLTNLGVAGVNSASLGLAHRLITRTADDGSEVDSIAKIDALLSEALVALNKIATAAENNNAAAEISAAEFDALGLSGFSTAVVAAYNSALDTAAVDAAQVGTIDGLESLLATYDQLIRFVLGQTDEGYAPGVAQYVELGVVGSERADLLPILNHALSGEKQTSVMDISALQGLVGDLSEAMDLFQAYSQAPDSNSAPSADIYAKLLIKNAEGLVDSVNSVLADSDVTIGADVLNEVQALVDGYQALNDYVAGTTGATVPSAQSLAALGVTQVSDARTEAYLADLLPLLDLVDVAQISQVEAYADAINALFYTADAVQNSITGDSQAITLNQLALLGHVLEATDYTTFISFIAEQGDAAVTDTSTLAATVNAVVTATARIAEYSEDPIAAVDTANGGLGEPTAQDYAVVLSGTGIAAVDVDAVNSALADDDILVGTADLQGEVRTVVMAYNAILAAADSIDNDAAIATSDLTDLGVNNVSTDADMNSLLLDVIDQRQALDVDTTLELQALNDAINALQTTINGTATITDAQLALIGITGATADNLDAIQITLAEGTTSDYNTLAQLQARVTTTVTALDKLTQHSTLDTDAANNPQIQDYVDAGISGVSDKNLLAVNAQVRLTTSASDKNSAAEIQAIVTAANDAIAVITNFTAGDTALTVEQYEAAGITGVSENNLLAVNAQALLETDTTAKDAVSEIQTLVTAANDAIAVITNFTAGDAALSVAQYEAAGITGVTTDNLLAVNAQALLETDTTAKDAVSEIQILVTAANDAIAVITNFTVGDTALTVAQYEAAGITGVTTDNLLAVNAQALLETDTTAKDAVSEIQAIVTAANDAIAVITNFTAGDTALTVEQYEAAGITGVSENNLLAVNAQALLETDTTAKDAVSEIQILVTAANDAIAVITNFTVGDTALTVAQYEAAGITGVTTDNLLAVNAQALLETDTTAKDAVAEIQTLVTAANDAIAVITNFTSGDTALTVAQYEAAGITGVSEDNLLAVNAQALLETDTTAKDAVAEIQTLVTAANDAIAVITNFTSGDTALTVAQYEAAGITGVTTDNLLAVNAQALLETDTTAKDAVSEIQTLVTAANDAIAVITNFTSGDTALTVAQYEAAGITGVTTDNLLAVNAQALLETDTTAKDAVSEIQAIVTAANDAIAVITNFTAGDTALTVEQYEAAGITGVSENNLLAVNAQALLETDTTAKDAVSEIQILVTAANDAIAVITNFTVGDTALTVAQYEAAGITGVTTDNLLAVNAQALLETDTTAKDAVAEIQTLVTAANDAIAVITNFTSGDTALTVAQYEAAGITGVSEDNLLAVNAQALLETDTTAKDAVAEIQTLVTAANDAIAVITNFTSGDTALTVAQYEAAGITGVTTDNLLAVNAQALLETDTTAKDAVSEIQTLVTAANDAIAVITNFTSGDTALTVAQYEAAGITGVTTDNLLAVNAQALLETDTTAKDAVSEIQVIVSAADSALAYILSDVQPLTSTVSLDATPQIAAYEAVGVTGVSADNLLAVNAQLRLETTTDNKDSVSEIQSLVTAANSALAYIASDIAPLTTTDSTDASTQIAAYEAAGITGVSADNLLGVNAQLRLESTAENKDSVSDIQAIVAKADAAIDVLTDATSAVSIPEYEAAGIVDVTSNNLYAVNQALLAAASGDDDTQPKLQAIVASAANDQQASFDLIVGYASELASATTAVAGDPSTAAQKRLTLPALEADAQYTLQVGTVLLEAHLTDPASAADLLAGFADTTDTLYRFSPFTLSLDGNVLVLDYKGVGARTEAVALRSERPALEDYALAGITGVDAQNLTAINHQVAGLVTADLADTSALQTQVTVGANAQVAALAKVVDFAADDANARPTLRDYHQAGLTAVTEYSLEAVNRLVQAADGDSNSANPTITDYASAAAVVNAGVTAYLDALNVISTYAEGADANAVVPSLGDYQDAGISGLVSDDIDTINAVLRAKETADVTALHYTTTPSIQAVVNGVLAGIQTLVTHAENDTASGTLTETDYAAVGAVGVDSSNLAALNDALDRPSISGADVRTLSQVQGIVDAYNRILAIADGTDDNRTQDDTDIGTVAAASDPTRADYAALELSGFADSTRTSAKVSLLNDHLDRLASGQVDTIIELQARADAIDALLRTAENQTPKITKAQLSLLGFDVDNADTAVVDDITDSNLSAVHKVLEAIDTTTDYSAITHFTQVETAIGNAIGALNAISANAQADTSTTDTTDSGLDLNGTTTGLDAADFAAMGVDGVTDNGSGSANNLSAVLSALDDADIGTAQTNTLEGVQAIVTAYNRLLNYVEDSANPAPQLTTLTTLGISDITTVEQLTLVNSYLADVATTTADIDSIDLLQAKVSAVNHILSDAAITDLAAGEGIDNVTASYVTTSADLEALGFTYVDTSTATATLVNAGQATVEVTPENIDSIRLAIANSADDLSELQTFSALKTRVEDTAKAANTIQAYGTADSSAATPEPTEDDYAAIGVTGVTSLNVAAINSSLAETGVLDTITSSVAADVQDIVDTWARVQALADGEVDTKDVSISYVDFMPTFSSSAATADGVTYTVSANDLWTDGWGTYHAYFAFDGGTADRNSWIADSSDGYDTLTVTTDDANGFKIGKYTIIHDDLYTYEGWELAGQYFDGSNWVWETIDSFATYNGGDVNYKNTTQTYSADLSISDQHNYQNFRFEITDSWAHTSGWYALPELTIFKAEETVSANNSLSLSVSDFELLGVRNNGAPITAIEANYLSHLLDKGEISDINAVEKIQNYYNALHALLTTADGTAVSDVTREQLNLLGITLVNSDTRYAAILGHIKTGTKSGSSSVAYNATIFDHFSEIRNELVATITGLTIVERAAEFDAATASNPTVGDYYGVNALSSNGADVTSSNLAAVNSMLNTSAVTGAIAADPAALRVLVGYYQEVLTAAADANAAGTLSLSVDNYQSIGLVGFSSNSAKADIQAALLNDVIEFKTAASAVDRIAEVQALSDAVVSVLRTVDGETPAITQAELELLGLTGITTNNLSAIQKALSDVDTSSNYDLVDTLFEVTAIVNSAIAALEAVKTEAGANDGDSVTASQLVAMGVEGAVETGSGANMALINSALDTTAIASANVDTLEKVQALVDAAAKVVALAGDTAAPRLVAGDLTKLGVDLTLLDSGNTKANAIALINDLLVADATAQISVGDIQTKANALGALIDDVVQTTPAALAITTADLEALGFNATSPSLLNGDGSAASTDITASNLQAIRLALSATADDLSDLASLSDLQTLVNDTAKAANKIENYAETASALTPTSAALIPDVADFEAIGATGVTTANLDFVLSALADDDVLGSITEINADIQGLVDVVHKLERLADGVDNVLEEGDSATTGFEATSAKLTAAELQALGINLVSDTNTQSAQVAMLGDFLDLTDAQSLTDITSIQTQADAIADVLANMALNSTASHNFATTDGSDGDGVSVASLQALGFTQASMDNLAGIRLVLARADYNNTTNTDTDTFETLNQRTELQTVVAEVVEALAKITAYADDSEANPAPTTDTYLYASITGVTADTLFAVNQAIDDAERAEAATAQAIQSLVDTGIAEHEAAVDKILAYNNVLVSATETIAGSDAPLTDVDAALVYEQQTLDLSGLTFTEGEQFTLRMGSHSLQSTALGVSPTAADLLAALQASPDYSAAEFTLSLSGTMLQLDWKEWGEITGTAELRSARPAIEDYALAGTQAREANGLTDELLYSLNSQIETGTFSAVTDAASLAAALDDIEAAAEAGITAQQAALTKIDTFAKDTTGQAAIPVIEDYRIAGVLGVHSGNIRAVNAQAALAEAASAGSADSLDEIAMIVAAADAAIARIDLYSRSGGTADLGSGQTVLTKADYDAVGLDYITEDNVVAVNLRLTEASEGVADTVNEIELIADKAIARQSAALQHLKDYGDASSATVPSLETFNDAAITGITNSNLALINDRIGSLADDADVLINTYVSNAQNYPSITSLSDGGWVVTWSSYTQDGSNWGIYQQRFDYTGAPVGDELRVNTYTSNHQIYPDVISLAGGGWVVSWGSYTQDGSVYGVYMQRFDAAGDRVGSEARVNTTTSNQQYYPTLGALSDGGWVVSWWGQGSGDTEGVFQQRYDADGNVVGGETRVNTTTSSSQKDPSIVGLADGGWVVAWMDNNGTDGSGWGIYQKRYDALGLEVVAGVDGSGNPVTGEVVVNNEWNGAQMYPSVTALSNGGWVVAWQDNNDLDGSGYSIALRVYSENGLPLGEQVLVNQYGTSTQEYVEITALEDGTFVAVWESYDQDDSQDGVYQRRFAADGTPLDDEQRVATVTSSEQIRPVVSALPNGDWVVSWVSNGNTADDNSSYGVFQKRFSGLTGQEVKADLDLSSEVQAIVDASTDAYAKILAFVDGDGSTTDLGDGTTTLTTLDYGNAGIDGIREPYLTRLNGWLNEQSATDFDSHTALHEGLLLQQAVYRIGDYINDVDHVAAPTLLELQALGIVEADVDNLKFIQNYLGFIDHVDGTEITYSDVTGYVADALQLVDKLQQLQGTGSHQYQLSAEEYRTLGLGDALYDDASNLYLINAGFANASQAEVQNWENASAAINASISAMNTVLNRADGYAGTGGIKDTEANQIEYTYGNVGSSPSHSTYPATKAWDGDTTTFWAGSNDDGTSNNINWIGRYANDAPLHVLESFSWVDRDNFGGRVPGYFTIQGWNGSTWTDIQTYSNSGTSDQSFNISSSNQNTAYRGFRIYVYYAQNGTDYVDLGEMNFYSRPGFLDLSVSQWNDLGFDFVNSSNYGLVNSALNSANLRYIDHQDLYTQMVDVARDAILSDINDISSVAEFNFDWRAINFLAGATVLENGVDTDAFANALQRLQDMNLFQVDTYIIKQILTTDAFLETVFIGEDGAEVVYSGQSSSDTTPDLIISLVDVDDTDQLFLLIDGAEVDLGRPTAEQILAREIVLDNFEVSNFDAGSDGDVQLQVKVVHDERPDIISDEFVYVYG